MASLAYQAAGLRIYSVAPPALYRLAMVRVAVLVAGTLLR